MKPEDFGYPTYGEYVCRELAKFFKDEPHKIGLWILSKNPLFGNISAAELFVMGRGHKVAQFVKAAMWENEAPTASAKGDMSD